MRVVPRAVCPDQQFGTFASGLDFDGENADGWSNSGLRVAGAIFGDQSYEFQRRAAVGA